MTARKFVLQTKRLGLRNWEATDVAPFVAMGKDPEVMRYFPKLLSTEESIELIEKLQQHFITHGYCYFAVEVLETSEFIGFTGLMNQTWESEFTPCVDMGWRLKRAAWGKGYASEAAFACLEAAFTIFHQEEVYAFAAKGNTASEKVMQKIGMKPCGTFVHPKIKNDPRFPYCFADRKKKTD